MKKNIILPMLLLTVSVNSFAQNRFAGAAKRAAVITDLQLCLEGNPFAQNDASSCDKAVEACYTVGMSKEDVAKEMIDFGDSFLINHKYELLANNKYDSSVLTLAEMKDKIYKEFPALRPEASVSQIAEVKHKTSPKVFIKKIVSENPLKENEYLLFLNISDALSSASAVVFDGLSLIPDAKGKAGKMIALKISGLLSNTLVASTCGVAFVDRGGRGNWSELTKNLADAYLVDAEGNQLKTKKEVLNYGSTSSYTTSCNSFKFEL